jgi:LysR family positive regulator for ilvC
MNTRTLKHFLALAESLHFGRASDAVNISISALSRNIRHLEEELGVTLFVRDNRSVAITRQGKVFEQYARDTLQRWNALQRELVETQGPLSGELSVYCSVTASYSILFDLLSKLRDKHPYIEIKLQTGDPEEALSRITSGKEEVTIAARPNALPGVLEFQPIVTSPLLFIAPRQPKEDFPAIPPKRAAGWAQIPMILSTSGLARSRVDAWFRSKKTSPRVYAQVAGNEAIVSMVSLGLGVGVVPRIVLDNSPLADRVRVLNIKPALEPYNIGLFTLKKNLKNPLVDAFWQLTRRN